MESERHTLGQGGTRPGGAHIDHVPEWRADAGREAVVADVGAGVRGVDHDAGGDDEADVVDAGGAAAEEDEVARFEGGAGWQDRPSVVLVQGEATRGRVSP